MAQFTSIKNLKPAKRYAEALMELSCDTLSYDKIYEDLNFVLNTISQNQDLADFLNSPPVSKTDKKDVLDKIFKGKIEEPILSFLFLLNENSRLGILRDIFSAFKNFIDEEKNIINADIISAVELNEVQKQNLVSKLQNKTGKAINPEYKLDNTIMGGFIIKINDTVIDLSLKNRIENLKKK